MAVSLITSYSETNRDDRLDMYTGSFLGGGETFTNPTSIPLYSVKFYINKVGAPTGNAVAKLYAITGTSGTNGTPTGSALATSDPLAVSSISTSGYALYELFFTGANAITLSASTNYVVTLEYTGGDASNYIQLGYDTSSPSYAGNLVGSFTAGSWISSSGQDVCFYLYGGTATVITDKTQSGIVRIKTVNDKTQTGITRITALTSRTQSGVTRIRKTVDRTQSGLVRIGNLNYIINGIPGGVGAGVVGMQAPGENLRPYITSTTTDRTQSGLVRIRVITDRSQTGTVRITTLSTKNQTGQVRIRVLTSRTQSGIVRIKVDTTKTITGRVRISTATTRNQLGIVSLRAVGIRNQLGKVSIVKASLKTITGRVSIVINTTKTQTGKVLVYNPLIDTGVYIPKSQTEGIFETDDITDNGVYIPKSIEIGRY